MGIAKTAELAHIPRAIIYNWRKQMEGKEPLPKGRQCLGGGRKPILSKSEEEELATWIITLRAMGLQLHGHLYGHKAQYFIQENPGSVLRRGWIIFDDDRNWVYQGCAQKRNGMLLWEDRTILGAHNTHTNVCSNGTKLPPTIIFKGKKSNHMSLRTLPKSRGTKIYAAQKKKHGFDNQGDKQIARHLL